jgi:hypothetical protein
MTEQEFQEEIINSKKSKTIKYYIISGFFISIGVLFILIPAMAGKLNHNIIAITILISSIFILIGIQFILSARNKLIITSITNQNNLQKNIILILKIKEHFGSEVDEIVGNFIYTKPLSKFLRSTYEIQLLALDNKILINIDSPGTNKKGIISSGMGRRKRKQIIEFINNLK